MRKTKAAAASINAPFSPEAVGLFKQLRWEMFRPDDESPETSASVLQEAYQQAVLLAAFRHGLPADLPAEKKPQVERLFSRLLSRNWAVFQDHAEVHRWLTEAGVPYCILKGVASASFYPDPLLRMMGDVDFLVAPEDVEAVDRLLREKGFSCEIEEHVCHRVYFRGRQHFELHYDLAGMPEGEVGCRLRRQLSGILQNAETVLSPAGEFRQPSRFHHGLILLLHTYHHLRHNGIGLRHLLDFALFANSFTEEAFLQTFRLPLEETGLWYFTRVLLAVSKRYLGGPDFSFCDGVDPALAECMMQDILEGGNFGRKNKNRKYEGLFIGNNTEKKRGNHSFLRIMDALQRVAATHFPRWKDHPVLLCLTYPYIILRRCVRILFGRRRRVPLREVIIESRTREKLYEQLSIFQIESESKTEISTEM